MIERLAHARQVLDLLGDFPVVAIVGARQTGKTTLANRIADGFAGAVHRFDLEDPRDEARLASPMMALEPLDGLVVIDEIQRLPALFPVLRVLADRAGTRVRYLILGSAAPELVRGSSESLAGRIAYHELPGLDIQEAGAAAIDRLWRRGGLPRSLLAASEAASQRWRREYIRGYLERDIPALGFRLAPSTLRRFWSMLAHYSGQLWNGAELARAFGVSEPTVRHYLDILSATCMVRALPPWHENLGKRQVKAPKIYLADSGVLHALLDIGTAHEALLGHPRVGASWEGFVVHQIVRALGVEWQDCHHWRLHTGAELDLLVNRDGRRLGFEIKRTDAPRVSPSMKSALDSLRLERLFVIHAGAQSWPLAERVEAVALAGLFERLAAVD
ncbi:MAG: ATP-binding protein [Rhodocyclaceae bacterium]|jgi:predicted AAA+ superfamily ATPase|nr:ATP-binding protein [Rhodocyclaceae bacterium]MBK6677749.1 ATP-binding protein [Rhodocyclaceae bacterium]MBK9310420.1 ATP-binding protein [Rhodocyclaceae bacterium]MBK9954508.1 ATP-binding protein [Rhodocyclaceae bacterium]